MVVAGVLKSCAAICTAPIRLFDPAMRALPPVFVVRLPSGPAVGWVKVSIDYAMAEAVAPSGRRT
jgi:hypothetical protein